ncbi:hypothetical protein [Actinoplanes sp. NPDC051851]|uniref:hypothetical protein n=1 Tax=Actinoplanes sp. NPDC051851 TaxID=3154753 RepID=UPI003447B197
MNGHSPDDEDLPPTTLREQGVIAVPVHSTATAGPLPDGWAAEWADSDARRARRLLANRLAAELLDAPESARVVGHDLFSAHVIAMRWDEVPMVALALEYAVTAPLQHPESTIIGDGPGGTVVRIHTPLFSVVFRFSPQMGPVLVLVDAMPDYAVRLDLDESQEGQLRVAQMTAGVLINMQIPGVGEIRAPIR